MTRQCCDNPTVMHLCVSWSLLFLFFVVTSIAVCRSRWSSSPPVGTDFFPLCILTCLTLTPSQHAKTKPNPFPSLARLSCPFLPDCPGQPALLDSLFFLQLSSSQSPKLSSTSPMTPLVSFSCEFLLINSPNRQTSDCRRHPHQLPFIHWRLPESFPQLCRFTCERPVWTSASLVTYSWYPSHSHLQLGGPQLQLVAARKGTPSYFHLDPWSPKCFFKNISKIHHPFSLIFCKVRPYFVSDLFDRLFSQRFFPHGNSQITFLEYRSLVKISLL